MRKSTSPVKRQKVIHAMNLLDLPISNLLQNEYGFDNALQTKAIQLIQFSNDHDSIRKKSVSPNRLVGTTSHLGDNQVDRHMFATENSNHVSFIRHKMGNYKDYQNQLKPVITATANTTIKEKNITVLNIQSTQVAKKDETRNSSPNSNNSKNALGIDTKVVQLNPRAEYVPNIRSEISEPEKVKIRNYFRTHISTLLKIIDEKLKKNISLYKMVSKTKNISKDMTQSSILYGNTGNVANQLLDPYVEEQLKDDIWKALKRVVSTKSKYKLREATNVDQRINAILKTVANNRSPRISRSPTKVILNDEEDSPTKKKHSEKKNTNYNNDYYMGSGSKNIKKHDPNSRVFIIMGGYPALKRALEGRGWVENLDSTSKIFNLKWTLRKADLNFMELMPHQLVNHFEKNTSITTKIGLARNIRNLIWFDNEDVDCFYPRTYDLNDVGDFDDFLEDFKYTAAQAILKTLNKANLPSSGGLDLFKLKIATSIDICERHSKCPGTMINMMFNNEPVSVTQNEWDILMAPNFAALMNNYRKYDSDIKKLLQNHKISIGTPNEPSNIFEPHLYSKVENVLKEIKRTNPQYTLNSIRNVWIIKPAGLSRGRGINCYNTIHDILEHIQVKETEWVAQKYIENPLIIANKKVKKYSLGLQWVLVTDWNPLTIWFYDECYIRFSADDYDINNLGNRFSHLTNNSIAKHSEKFEDSEISGNMWTCMEFAQYLERLTGEDEFYKKIQPKMKQCVIKSLLCVQNMVENRKNSFELYGYDFMVDDYFKPWLIEINSSPAMDYSTTVTERLVKMVLEDCVKVIVDYGMNKAKLKKQINTGSFKCIYEGKVL